MPSTLPIADPAPLDGLLPASVVDGATERNLGVYIHVPFCRVRCGYCDFNTYTSDELRGARRQDYASQAIAELDGRMSRAEAIAETQALTRKYARRQVGWFRRYPVDRWIDAQAADGVEVALATIDR